MLVTSNTSNIGTMAFTHESPHETLWRPLGGPGRNEELLEYIKKRMPNKFKLYPDIKCMLKKQIEPYEKRIRRMEVYDDDVWVLTYPRCGTTWCQEMCWLIMNNLDYKGAEKFIFDRSPFLEFDTFMHDYYFLLDDFLLDDLLLDDDLINKMAKVLSVTDALTHTENLPRPRIIKSHLPLALLPSQLLEKKPKIICVLREPKDVAVSYYHYFPPTEGSCTTEEFFEAFLEGRMLYGSFWHFSAPLWKMRNDPNVLVLTYEEMKKDLESVVRRTAKFLGKTISEEDMPGLLDHLSFNKMKTNDAFNMKNAHQEVVQHFVLEVLAQSGVALQLTQPSSDHGLTRKGEVGDHKNVMSPEMIKKFNETHSKMKRDLGMNDFPY